MKNFLIIFYTLTILLSGNMAKGSETNEIISLEKPTFEYYKSEEINQKRDESIQLEKLKADSNNIIDTEEWFKKNHIYLDAYSYYNPLGGLETEVPSYVKKEFQGNILIEVTTDFKYIYAFYNNTYAGGRYLIVYDMNTGEEKYAFDFIQYFYSGNPVMQMDMEQLVRWAVIEDNVLYVSTAGNGYAHLVNNENAYITAIDLEDYKILWQSDALVANSNNFQIIGDTVITGYGFTDEEDYIYLIDKWTGEVYEAIDINSKAEYFIMQEDILYVRTYDTDYQFKIQKRN